MKPNEILRRIRDKKTQKEAADLLEISLPKYNRLENNKCDFDKKVIEKISEVFDFPFDLLFMPVGEKAKNKGKINTARAMIEATIKEELMRIIIR